MYVTMNNIVGAIMAKITNRNVFRLCLYTYDFVNFLMPIALNPFVISNHNIKPQALMFKFAHQVLIHLHIKLASFDKDFCNKLKY